MRLEEMLVATVCVALLAAALLPVVVDGATVGSARLERLAAEQAVSVLADRLRIELRGAGRGLEGAVSVRVDDEVVPALEASAAGRLRFLLTGEVREVARLGVARYLAGHVDGLRRGDRVAALGLGGDPATAPAGRLLRVDRRRRVLTVAWPTAAGERIAADGPPRALMPFRVREYGVRRRDGGRELWRRDDGGPRQPVVDRLRAFRVRAPAHGGIVVEVELEAGHGGTASARVIRR